MRALQDSQATRRISGGSSVQRMSAGPSGAASASSPHRSNPSTPQNQPTPEYNAQMVGSPAASHTDQATTPGMSNPLLPFLPNGGANLNMSAEAAVQSARLREAQAAKAKLAQAMAGRAAGVPQQQPIRIDTTQAGTPGADLGSGISTIASAVPSLSQAQTPATPASGGATSSAPRPPASNAIHFFMSLSSHLQRTNYPIPPHLFGLAPPKPELPGSAPAPPGSIDIFGRNLDLMKLWMSVLQFGGYDRVSTHRQFVRGLRVCMN
jgi:hypothetical protein